MTVEQVSNGAEAERLKPKDVEAKKKAEQKQHDKRTPEAAQTTSADRVEISKQAKILLQNGVQAGDDLDSRLAKLSGLEPRILRRLYAELDGEAEVRADKIEDVRQKLAEEYYERPEVLLETAERIVAELFGTG